MAKKGPTKHPTGAALGAEGRVPRGGAKRHCGSGCNDQYMSLTFTPSHEDLSDFVRVAPFADLAYARDAADEELVEVSGEGGCAVVHLTQKQRQTLGQRISAGRRGGVLHGAVHRRSARSLTCRSHTGAMVRAVFVFEGNDLSVHPSVESRTPDMVSWILRVRGGV